MQKMRVGSLDQEDPEEGNGSSIVHSCLETAWTERGAVESKRVRHDLATERSAHKCVYVSPPL